MSSFSNEREQAAADGDQSDSEFVELIAADDTTKKDDNEKIVVMNESEMADRIGAKAILFLALWYFWSGCTLFFNKYIVAYLKGDPTILGCTQMIATLVLGYVQLYFPLGMFELSDRKASKHKDFAKNMTMVGIMRFSTVILGLFALNYVEVSFTETVKSTAPAFTVVISRFIVGEETGPLVKLSLLPVMGGLALCSANELSFNMIGFIFALATNVSECLQNVYSKMLISGKGHKYNPAEMQYYTSLASLIIQLPAILYLVDLRTLWIHFTKEYLLCCVLNGVFFHLQTISAYVLMDYISPVTHSVANTAKRALLIWLSVLLFGNPVTLLSGMGTATVILGVLLYNKARQLDSAAAMTNNSITT